MKRLLPVVVGVVITLASAGVALAANMMLRTLVAPPQSAPLPREATEVVRDVSPKIGRTLSKSQYITGILKRNIFDPSAIGQGMATSDGDTEAVTDLDVRLLGTVVAVPERYSSALILDAGRNDEIGGYGVGDKLHDAEVVGIEVNKVTLKRGNGAIEVLTLSEEKGSIRNTASTRSSSGTSDEGIEQTGDNQYAVARDTVDRYLTDLDAIAGLGRAIPHRGPDGQIDGYRLSGIRRGSIGSKLGIKNGDIVHSVNGHALDSMQGAMQAYTSLQSESAFQFEVTRRGQKMNMEYEIQ